MGVYSVEQVTEHKFDLLYIHPSDTAPNLVNIQNQFQYFQNSLSYSGYLLTY